MAGIAVSRQVQHTPTGRRGVVDAIDEKMGKAAVLFGTLETYEAAKPRGAKATKLTHLNTKGVEAEWVLIADLKAMRGRPRGTGYKQLAAARA